MLDKKASIRGRGRNILGRGQISGTKMEESGSENDVTQDIKRGNESYRGKGSYRGNMKSRGRGARRSPMI